MSNIGIIGLLVSNINYFRGYFSCLPKLYVDLWRLPKCSSEPLELNIKVVANWFSHILVSTKYLYNVSFLSYSYNSDFQLCLTLTLIFDLSSLNFGVLVKINYIGHMSKYVIFGLLWTELLTSLSTKTTKIAFMLKLSCSWVI